MCSDPAAVSKKRSKLLEYWKAGAEALKSTSTAALDAIVDPHLRRLLRGAPDAESPTIGKFFHVELQREMALAGDCQDKHLIDELLAGMTIVGEVARSNR